MQFNFGRTTRFFALVALTLSALTLGGCGLFKDLGPDEPFKFPQEDVSPIPCTSDSDCSGDATCSSDGFCSTPSTSTPCATDDDCGTEETCQNEICQPIGGGTSCTSDGDCDSGQICQSGQCVTDTGSGSCATNDDCNPGQVCDVPSGNCIAATCDQDPGICGPTEKCVSGVCECDENKTQCAVSAEACEVLFSTTLALKIDDANDALNNSTPAGHFDSPPACCQYAAPDGQGDCPIDPGQIGGFLKAPSENTDLYCCAADDGQDIPGRPDLYCDTDNRHGGVPELAVQRWSAHQGAKIRLKFDLSQGCTVEMNIADFPEYRLENSALDAGLIIDAGKNYRASPMNQAGDLPVRDLNPASVISTCTVTEDNQGNVQISIDDLKLRFMTALYVNHTQCEDVDNRANCPAAFSELFNGDSAQSYQIIPGFNHQPLSLGTGERSQPVIQPALQDGAMTLTGSPLHFDTNDNKSKMTIVAAFSMPSTLLNASFRDDDLGTGQLLAQLGDAQLTATLAGTITKADGVTPIQKIEDLTTNCDRSDPGPGPGPGGGGGPVTIDLGLTTEGDEQAVNVVEGAGNVLTATVCIPGQSLPGGCQFGADQDLPFAKGPGDPLAGLEDRFVQAAELFIQNQAGSQESIILALPDSAGSFTIVNAGSLSNVTLAPGQSTTINILFEPEIDGAGCVVDDVTGYVNCDADLSLSSSHQINVALSGRAKQPIAEMKLEEIAVMSPNDVLAASLPDVDEIDFGEALVGVETKTKLFKLSNQGVRELMISSLDAQDGKGNFRLGSIYQGTDFQSRIWRIGQQPWTVSPLGNNDLFFFLNYGPFGSVPDTGDNSIREDTGALVLATSAGNETAILGGQAKQDRRAILSLYIQDENRFGVTGAADLEGPNGEHLYRFREQLFSFRQDASERAFYIHNDGPSAGIDNLIIREFTHDDSSGKFTLNQEQAFTDAMTACSGDPANCLTLQAAGDPVKVGTIQFAASDSGQHQISASTVTVTAVSTKGGGEVAPIIGGNADNANSATQIVYDLKGASGAPSGTFDLKLHRLIAGFEQKLDPALQKSLIVSSATKGILERFNNNQFPPNDWKEVYTLSDGITLNAETGEATLKKIITAVDANPSNPARPGSVNGLRVYNGPGSVPQSTEYFVECKSRNGFCGFFYLFIGDWNTSIQQQTCNGKTLAPVATGYSSLLNQGALDAIFNTAFNPETDLACLQGTGPADGIADAKGLYDPVTGNFEFRDLAIRFYAPDVPQLNKDVDATMRLSLTTGCVNEAFVPDPAALPQYRVPQATLDDPDFDRNLMPSNPLEPYVDTAGTNCGQRELHGRPMFQDDTTGTLDNGSDSDDLSFKGFDIAGVGRNVSSSGQVFESNMYIVIKAEVK